MHSVLMTATAWLLTYMCHSTILLGAAWVVSPFLARRAERTAELMWRVALFAPLLSATLQLCTFMRVQAVDARSLAAELPVSASRSFDTVLAVSVLCVIIAGCVRIFLTVVSHVALLRRIAGRVPLMLPPNSMLTLNIRVSVSRVTSIPFALGHREIVLPARALDEMPRDQLVAVLAHEAAHIVRRDWLWLTAATLLQRALFLQPLNLLAHRRLRLLAECACDAWAAERVPDRLAIASALATVTGWMLGARESGLVLAMATCDSSAVKRLRRILDPVTERGSAPVMLTSSLALVLLVLLFIPAVGVSDGGAPRFPYTVIASDDAGAFTLTMNRGRAIAGTVNGVRVNRTRVQQHGATIRLLGANNSALVSVRTDDRGGFSWMSRHPQ